MQCPFCKHEVNNGVQECPYCHYQFDTNAEVLSSDERDSFEGVTIEEDGSTSDSRTTYEEKGSYEETNPQSQQQPNYGGFQVRQVGGYGCLIWSIIILFFVMLIVVSFFKLIFAVPILGFFFIGYILNSMFKWF